jgi:acetyl-CoA acyltransferase
MPAHSLEHTPVICGFVRTPFTPAYRGQLAEIRAEDLLITVIQGLLSRCVIPHDTIEDVMVGCAFPEGEQGLNIGRIVALASCLPEHVAGVTVNRFCGSSMQAIHMAAGQIRSGAGDVFICAGVESMSRVPMTGFNPMPHPRLIEEMPDIYESMGITAENIAAKTKITRDEQEAFALESHRKMSAPLAQKAHEEDILPVKDGDQIIALDGCVRPDSQLSDLAKLKPAFLANGSVTAATSSPLTDGAVAVLVTSHAYAKLHHLPILAEIAGMSVAGCAPGLMGMGPVPAVEKLCKRYGVAIGDIEIIELNEAFAVQSLACMRALHIDPSRVNLQGGAIAMGHPLGASGARITATAARLLHADQKARFALATQCIGGGQGIATLLKRID